MKIGDPCCREDCENFSSVMAYQFENFCLPLCGTHFKEYLKREYHEKKRGTFSNIVLLLEEIRDKLPGE